MKLAGFIGPAYTLDDTDVDYQRAVNIYPEVTESGSGKGQQVAHYKSTPGLDEVMDLGTGPIRLIHDNKNGRLFIVSAAEVYTVSKPVTLSFVSADVTVGTDTITERGHGYVSGDVGQLTTDGTLPTGLSLSTNYYVIPTGLDTYQLATTWANALLGVEITITGAGSGTHTFTPTNNAAGYQSQLVGSIATSSGVVRAASNDSKNGVSGETTIFVDGNTDYIWASSLGGDGAGPFNAAAGEQATDIVFVDGYFIKNDRESNSFYVSEIDSANFNALSVYTGAAGDPDNVVGFAINNKDLYVLNERTTEVFVNTGNSDFPFERVQGGFIETGALSLGSISRIMGQVLFLGRDEFGEGVVYSMSGSNAQRISTHAIERAIAGYADASATTSYCYQSKGHNFYILNFAEATWVYDLNTGLWHERAYTNAGTLERQRPDVCSFYPKSGDQLLGDYSDGKVFIYNDSTYTDNGDAITRLRITPYISNENYRLFCSRLWLDMKTGIGLISGQGSDPQVMLRWSDDGGYTWSDESWTSAGGQTGGIGEYSTRVFWNRLGAFRQRIFEFKITDPVPVTFIDATFELKKGRH